MVQVHLDGDRQCRYTSAMDSGTACTEPGKRLEQAQLCAANACYTIFQQKRGRL